MFQPMNMLATINVKGLLGFGVVISLAKKDLPIELESLIDW